MVNSHGLVHIDIEFEYDKQETEDDILRFRHWLTEFGSTGDRQFNDFLADFCRQIAEGVADSQAERLRGDEVEQELGNIVLTFPKEDP